MPSVSKAQQRTMQAAAHSPAFAAEVGIPVKVAKDFNNADKAAGNVGKSADLPARAPARFKEHRVRGRALGCLLACLLGLGLGTGAYAEEPDLEMIGKVRLKNGGTGATNALAARTNLGALATDYSNAEPTGTGTVNFNALGKVQGDSTYSEFAATAPDGSVTTLGQVEGGEGYAGTSGLRDFAISTNGIDRIIVDKDTGDILFGSFLPSHLRSGQPTAPALSSCGTGSPAISGTDTAGTVTMGTSASGCVITFSRAYVTAPHCVVTWRANMLAAQSYAISNTALTLTQTSASGNLADYFCVGAAGG